MQTRVNEIRTGFKRLDSKAHLIQGGKNGKRDGALSAAASCASNNQHSDTTPNRLKKKIPMPFWPIGTIPFFFIPVRQWIKTMPLPPREAEITRAGLLASGSSSARPSHACSAQWALTGFVPGYSGGTAPVFNGIPYYVLWTPAVLWLRLNQTGRWLVKANAGDLFKSKKIQEFGLGNCTGGMRLSRLYYDTPSAN